MESCWESGGPEWLFGVVLWAALIGAAGFLMWLPVPEDEPAVLVQPSSRVPKALQWMLAAALLAFVGMDVFEDGFGSGDIVWAFGPFVAIAAVAFVVDRAPRLGRWFLLTVWVGGAAAAVGAIVAMFYLGHPC